MIASEDCFESFPATESVFADDIEMELLGESIGSAVASGLQWLKELLARIWRWLTKLFTSRRERERAQKEKMREDLARKIREFEKERAERSREFAERMAQNIAASQERFREEIENIRRMEEGREESRRKAEAARAKMEKEAEAARARYKKALEEGERELARMREAARSTPEGRASYLGWVGQGGREIRYGRAAGHFTSGSYFESSADDVLKNWLELIGRWDGTDTGPVDEQEVARIEELANSTGPRESDATGEVWAYTGPNYLRTKQRTARMDEALRIWQVKSQAALAQLEAAAQKPGARKELLDRAAASLGHLYRRTALEMAQAYSSMTDWTESCLKAAEREIESEAGGGAANEAADVSALEMELADG